uniref:Uncharacterized protein n=1 Tax=Timema cristinae TaxID=61476 RepID=A0A7R9CB79_TIMCR|nr:unnamed protein product [Timema cristinae]
MVSSYLFVLLVVCSILGHVHNASDEENNIIKKDERNNEIKPETSTDIPTILTTEEITKPTVTKHKAPPTPKPSGGEAFSRFINDIFQIPISVLKAVNNLLTNPFTRGDAKKTDH